MVSLLLEFNANVHNVSDDGLPALSHAARQGHIEIVRLLLSKKAKVSFIASRIPIRYLID